MLDDVLRQWNAHEVDAMTVYTDIFQLGSGRIQKADTESRNVKSNPLGYWKNNEYLKGHYRIMFDDTFEESLRELQEADFAIINGITYFGRKNLQAAANKMYCMIFDLDGVTETTLNNFLSGAIKAEAYPVPNYIALSGHGAHLYYLFEEPLSLYPNIKIQLKNLKYGLTEKMWNPYTSIEDTVQHQGINQGFRPIGGKTKIPGVRVRAFALNPQKFTVGELGEYVLPEYRVKEEQIYKESRMTLEEARKKYPEWYQRRINDKDKSKGHWTCKRNLYDWWKGQIRMGATFHHRYFNIMCLAIYAVKAGIDEEELKRDALQLMPFMNDISPENPFTEADIESALECYDERYITFPIEDISRLSGITIQRNKRNGRKQAVHLEGARAIQAINDRVNEKSWREGNGRKSKGDVVAAWQEAHPDGKKCECIRETGLSKPTVYKYWKS